MGIKYYIFFLYPFLLFSKQDIHFPEPPLFEQFLQSESDSSKSYSFFNFNIKNGYKIHFLLPFCIERNDSLLDVNVDSIFQLNEILIDLDFYGKSKISIDFFHGFLMSLDSFPNLNIELSVFDLQEGDSSKVVLNRILDEKILNSSDLIVGPLFADNFVLLRDKFHRNIPIINPFSKKERITNKNPNVFQIQSNINNNLSFFSNYIFSQHTDDHILLISRDTIFDASLVLNSETSQFTTLIDTLIPKDIDYKNAMLSDLDVTSFDFEEVKVNANVIDSIHHKLDTLGIKNVIIIPSEDNVFVTDLLSKLHACRDTNMVVYGLSNLFDFDYMSIVDLMDMKLTFPYNKLHLNKALDTFLFDFYDKYHYLPNLKYASVGYEVGIYFLSLLSDYGSIMPHISSQDSKVILETVYDFQQDNNRNGYKNKGIVILRYHDFGYQRIY